MSTQSSFFGLGSGGGRNLPNTSWKNVSEPVSSAGGFTGKPIASGRTDWTKGAEFLGGFLSKMGQDKYRSEANDYIGPRALGYPSFGGSGQILENLGVVYPQQQAPFFIPGSEGGGKSTGQRIAGGLGGALSGAATGAAFGPIGIAAGALLGGASGAFG